jgi:hypothetical protein
VDLFSNGATSNDRLKAIRIQEIGEEEFKKNQQEALEIAMVNERLGFKEL